MRALGSIDSVVVAIQEDARAEVERIVSEAAPAIARLREEDARLPVVVSDADVRVAAARRGARERLAEQDWGDRQAALTAREAWIARVVAEGQRRLGAMGQGLRRQELLRLASEAVARISGDSAELLVPAADAALADEAFRAELGAASGKAITVTAVTDLPGGGCIARSADGRTSYDNTYTARARRFESYWRLALGELFDRAPARSSPGAGSVSPSIVDLTMAGATSET